MYGMPKHVFIDVPRKAKDAVSSSELENNDNVSEAFCWNILRRFLYSLFEGNEDLDKMKLSGLIWKGDFEIMNFEGAFFEEIQFMI